MIMYVVKYSGPFGFIKPWTAVRDSETYSQQFLTESELFGMECKLFPELLPECYGIKKIKSYRLTYGSINQQQEQIQPRGWNEKGRGKAKTYERPYAVLTRGILINPILYLCFDSIIDAEVASTQHICLCRNEDLLFPEEKIIETTEFEFNNDEDRFYGFELVFERTEHSFMVGYNRFNNNQPMYGWLKTVGNPVKQIY
ncbi:MAG: hypothetical protein HC831_11940 [Chloroflexia bacterium]|nr:hypothetical protein [Bacteroidales bacterium]NJO89572.1 hypothetical protein [Chloroflexia bacterium]